MSSDGLMPSFSIRLPTVDGIRGGYRDIGDARGAAASSVDQKADQSLQAVSGGWAGG